MHWKVPTQPIRIEEQGILPVYLLRDVEKYLRSHDIAAARFGREAMGDPRFVFDLRNGREPRERTVRRVRSYLENHA